MIISMYAVRDSLLGFSMPVLRDNDAVASRAFEFDCSRDDSPYKIHPEQFQLYKIGEYNTDNAEIVSIPVILVASANDFIRKE